MTLAPSGTVRPSARSRAATIGPNTAFTAWTIQSSCSSFSMGSALTGGDSAQGFEPHGHDERGRACKDGHRRQPQTRHYHVRGGAEYSVPCEKLHQPEYRLPPAPSTG